MSVDRLFNVPGVPTGPLASGRDRTDLESLKTEELAREFESIMMLQMLRQMRQSMVDETDEEQGLSASTWLDTIDTELARQLSNSGGLGLADVMIAAIRRQSDGTPQPQAVDEEAVTPMERPESAIPAAAARDTVPAGGVTADRLTSDFGWRTDPFTGAPRYHQGIDLRAAYGQGVPAAAGGRVVEAGDRGAYGLSVTVEHENGLRTRYAHLSTIDVAPGDRVLQGQEIGRVGQSGRATGPHLHFEVIRNGQRIDPTTVMALHGSGLGGLKLAGADADFPVGGHVHTPVMTGVDDED